MNLLSDFTQKNRKELGMFALLLFLCIWTTLGTRDEGVEALFESRFLSTDNIVNVTRQIGFYGIFSIGVGLVIITSGIELSVGSAMSLLGVFFFFALNGQSVAFMTFDNYSWQACVGFVMLLGILLGLFHGFFIAKVKMQAFIVTLCGLLTYRGLARTISGEEPVGIALPEIELFETNELIMKGVAKLNDIAMIKELATGESIGFPMPFLYLICIALIAFIVLHKSVLGRYIYAVGRNELATKYSGVNTTKVLITVYVISGLLTAISAILIVFYTEEVQPSNHANFFELYAIAAAVLGGCSLRGGEGSIIGILIGTSIIIVLQNMVNLLGYDSSLADVITGGVIFFGVMLDQVGIAGIKKIFFRPKAS